MSFLSIDLGTTHISVVLCETEDQESQLHLVNDPESCSPRINPCVTYGANGWLIGERARREQSHDPTSVVYAIKQLLTLPPAELNPKLADWPFHPIVTRELTTIKLGHHVIQASMFVQIVFHTVAQWAQKQFLCGEPFTEVILTVPHHFSDSQRESLSKCARDVGFQTVHLIDDQTAAALVYQQQCRSNEETKVIIFNQGASTFHVSIYRFFGDQMEELGTVDDGHTGGDDYDQRLLTHVMNQLTVDYPDLKPEHCPTRFGVLQACKLAKHDLTRTTETVIRIPDENLPDRLTQTCNRELFKRLNADLFAYLRILLESLLQTSGVRRNKVDEIVLVGGATKVPRIEEMIREYFGPRVKINDQLRFDHVFACGGAIQLAHLRKWDKITLPEYIENPPLEIVSDPSPGVQSPSLAISSTEIDRLLEPVGFQVDGLAPVMMFPVNSSLPAHKESIYSIQFDYQLPSVIRIWAGDVIRGRVRDDPLGVLKCPEIPPMRKGTPVFRVTFTIDASTQLTVSVVDLCTGSESRLIISKFAPNTTSNSTVESRRIEHWRTELERDIRTIQNSLDSPLAQTRLSTEHQNRVKEKCDSIQMWITSSEKKSVPGFERKRQELLDAWLDCVPYVYS
ncbi:unnamed protein product [Echinostoma caproni]|uniref:Hsp70 family protein n=1 Tax=Echinostoma caproni TaxID=27848 RepID=A0A183AGI9_9TREM|nr:unnamed protein product [Echinostoma caproni]